MAVYVDCTANGSNAELQKRYGVTGYPTIIYVEPSGRSLGRPKSRNTATIRADLQALARRFPGKAASMWAPSWSAAVEEAKKGKIPLALYLTDGKGDFSRFSSALGPRRARFVWVSQVATPLSLQQHGVDAAPTLVILDQRALDPRKAILGRIPLPKELTAEEFLKALDGVKLPP